MRSGPSLVQQVWPITKLATFNFIIFNVVTPERQDHRRLMLNLLEFIFSSLVCSAAHPQLCKKQTAKLPNQTIAALEHTFL